MGPLLSPSNAPRRHHCNLLNWVNYLYLYIFGFISDLSLLVALGSLHALLSFNFFLMNRLYFVAQF